VEGHASRPPDQPADTELPKVERRWIGASAGSAPKPEPDTRPKRDFKSDPAWDKLLLVAGAIAVVVALLVVPGIVNRGGQNPVAAAAEATSAAGGVRVNFTGSLQGAAPVRMSGRGVMNGETNRASITMSATGSTASGTQGFTLEEVVDDGNLYLRSPQLGAAFGGPSKWMLLRSEAFGDLLQSSASGAGMSASPTQQLDALKDASYEVTEVGRDQLNGTATTHYRALIDVDELTDEIKGEVSGEFGDLIERSMDQISSATVDVWIDPNGLLRRETSTSTMGSLGSFTMTMDFSHYGIRPDMAVPPSSEVFDVTPLMERALDELDSSSRRAQLVVAAAAVPHVELHRLAAELHQAGRREPLQDQFERALLRDPLLKGLLTAEAGGEFKGLAAILAEGVEGAHQEVAVRDRLADLHRAVPGGEHGDVVLVELGDRLGVVLLELLVGNLVDPGAHRLAEELAAGLTAD
jgi:hypothetical protein